ncbi:ABC transporter ATP-binding protein [Hazenella coriacea]|uniref:ATP-binding cassette subfamily B protein AbcA/BmrA n=1 Tax=Hazenella coriacea TaxID=1179467 RepID=A0A4R3L8H1_9BACL|nr:ABC transporter ATP-binding protein [Hazenella coriacea]TCS95959.1 ATP-binding cassette subfamily B protein AbcA/BmrA [Hazenella coriacea]
MGEKQESVNQKMNWKEFIHLIKETNIPKWVILIAIGLSFIETVVSLAVPWLTKDLIDILTAATWNLSTILLLVGAFLVQAITGGVSTYLLSYLGETVVANLRRKLWNKTLQLPIHYFDQHRSGEFISRINNDTMILKEMITNYLIQLFSSVVSVLGALVLLLYLDWEMTLVMLITLPILFLVIRPMGRKMYEISRSLQKETANFTSLLTQVVSEIRLVKSYTAEPYERKNGESGIQHLFQYGLKEARIVAFLQPLMSLAMMVMLVLTIGYGGLRIASGALTAGELVAYILYLFKIIVPLSMMARFYTSLQKAMGASERLNDILIHEEETYEESGSNIDSNQQIVVERVSFSYPTSDLVLQELTFTIQPGQVTAIVGPSGSGKTTLFSLLERFYQPTSGEIRMGETPIGQFNLCDWRSQFGYVAQESPLLAGTVRDNICYGMEQEVTDEEVERAARLAYADEFIQELPQGYLTEVGERGIKLSGGQRQRIAIARALLQDPKILMLDEATSNLDSTSEQMVQEALANLMKGRTTIVIAHRLSTVADADQIVVMEKGTVTGNGTHQELLQSHELYRKLVEHQFKMEVKVVRES